MRIGFGSTSFVGIALTCFATSIASAQATVGVSVVSERVDHRLLGTMFGGTASVEWRSPSHRWTFGLSGTRTTGENSRIGVMCAGLVPPGAQCNPQPVRDHSSMQGGAVSVGAALYSTPRVWVSVIGETPISVIHVESRGLTDGKMLPISKTYVGLRGGVRAGWAPFKKLPIAIEMAGMLGALHPFVSMECSDCYDPINSGLTSRSMQIGVALRDR